LADAYVMPSHGEGFGFVLLEAMASGVPTVGSRIDGGREALRDGMLGTLVDPADRKGLTEAILAALGMPRGVPDGLEYFDYPNFRERFHRIMDEWLLEPGAEPAAHTAAFTADRQSARQL
jgi:glycosyltransferase involved in cell wall biosynthesis